MTELKGIKVLIAEDDYYSAQGLITRLEFDGVEAKIVSTLTEAMEEIEDSPPDIVVIDIMMPPGERGSEFLTRGGFQSGLVLAKWITLNHPDVKFIGYSAYNDQEIIRYFKKYGQGYETKPASPRTVVNLIKNAINSKKKNELLNLKTFIVHGHDEKIKYELKNYLQNSLHLVEPVILHEKPSSGKTVIEKFESYAYEIDIAFVLMTPDDLGSSVSSEDQQYRARQNVIFELGYFIGVLGRKSGSVIILYSGPLEIPSDLAGVIYIDISSGISAAGEEIRRELIKG